MNTIRRILLCTALALLAGTTAARTFEESYQEIRPPQPTDAQGKIEVLEIFWYGCPHCYSFEPYLDKWLQSKPDDVVFVRMPGVLNPAWIPHARAFYTAQKLGVLDTIHMPLFHALHRDRKRIFSEEELRDFFVEQGVKAEDFERVYRSNEIDTRVKQALVKARGARITGVPAVIVNGRYMTTGTLTGTFENLLQVVDQLIALERKPAAE